MGVVPAGDIVDSALGADGTVNLPEARCTERSKIRKWLIRWNVVICRDEQQAFRKRDAGGSGIPSASSRPTIHSFHMRCKIHYLLDTNESLVSVFYAPIPQLNLSRLLRVLKAAMRESR